MRYAIYCLVVIAAAFIVAMVCRYRMCPEKPKEMRTVRWWNF